jgi:hypothetical protein
MIEKSVSQSGQSESFQHHHLGGHTTFLIEVWSYGPAMHGSIAVPGKLAYHSGIENIFLIDHLARILGKLATGHSVHHDLGHSDLAFGRFTGGFVIDVVGHAFELPFSISQAYELIGFSQAFGS